MILLKILIVRLEGQHRLMNCDILGVISTLYRVKHEGNAIKS